jgi:hypothetical protein
MVRGQYCRGAHSEKSVRGDSEDLINLWSHYFFCLHFVGSLAFLVAASAEEECESLSTSMQCLDWAQ